MARTSAKHNPRQDDQLKHEEHALLHGNPDEGRTEPRRAEAPGPGDEADVGMRPDVAEPQGPAPSQRDVEARAALAATFPPSLFPARRDELVAAAEAAFAEDDLVASLRTLPDSVYTTSGEVWVALNEPPGGDEPA
jgi:Protein of unknown function (DUF2795)